MQQKNIAFGSYTMVTADDTANLTDITTGLERLHGGIAQVLRSGVVIGNDAVVTFNTGGAGKLRVADGSTYKLTAGDVLSWVAWAWPQ